MVFLDTIPNVQKPNLDIPTLLLQVIRFGNERFCNYQVKASTGQQIY